MSQGKAFTPAQRKKIIGSLKPYFRLGCNLKKACSYAGVNYNTVWEWVDADEALRIEITAWQNEISAQARKNYKKKIQDGDFHASDKWLSKKEKDEFSERQELTGEDGEALKIGFDNSFKDENK